MWGPPHSQSLRNNCEHIVNAVHDIIVPESKDMDTEVVENAIAFDVDRLVAVLGAIDLNRKLTVDTK